MGKKLFVNSLQRRILFFFTMFILVLSVTTTYLSVRKSLAVATDVFSIEGISVADKAAALIDGDKFETLSNSLDVKDPFFEETRQALAQLHSDASIIYLYTITPGGNTGHRYVIDASGKEGSAASSSMGTEINPKNYGAAFAKVWKTQTRQHSSLEKSDFGYLVSIFEPIKNSRGVMVGVIGLDFDAQSLYELVKSQVIEQIILGAIFIVAGIVIMILFMRLIFVRIGHICEVLETISQEKKSISTKIAVKGNDEIDRLTVLFNQTLSRISGLIALIKDQSINLSNAGHELSENMVQTAAAVTEITGNIQGIKSQVVNQSASVVETNSTMEQVVENIGQLNTHVEAQTQSVSQSSSAIEEMLANIQNVTNTLIKNSENVERLTSASDLGRASLEEVSQDIRGIAKESEGLLEINAVMENIASQTNLLSMNAAIEAAHAGEVGKGFAVVAGEIRKLAESSSQQSKTISDVLKKIKNSIDKITKSTESVMNKFQDIDTEVRTVSQQESNIRDAMEEQSVGSKQILEAIGRLQETTNKVQEGSTQMLKGSQDVIREGKNLTAAAQQISASINEIASGADYIDSAVGRVHKLSDSNSEHIDTLAKEVERFKLERTLEYEWSESLSVENKEIDAQHRELLAAMNKLIRVCTEGGDNKVDFKECIEFLCSYVVKHFADEEVLQQSYGYPDYPNHKKIHEALTKAAGDLAAKWLTMEPNEALVKNIREQLGEVIVNHIRTQDTKVGAFIRSKKVKQTSV